MKISWVILLVLLSYADAQAQKNKCNCEAFLSTTFSGVEKVYQEAGKTTELFTIVNRPLDEDFIHVTLLAQKGASLQVAPFGIEKYYDTGWVNNENIAVYGKSDKRPVNIYKKADTTSNIITTVPAGLQPEYKVTGCKGDWLEVTVNYNNEQYTGWLAPQDQCGSAYISCE